MGLIRVSAASVDLPVGGLWDLRVVAVDENDRLATATAPVLAITKPPGVVVSPAVAFALSAGGPVWVARYTTLVSGLHLAHVTGQGDALDFAAHVTASLGVELPTLDDLLGAARDGTGYLGVTSHAEAQVADALDAETAAQRDVCRTSPVYTVSLRQALLRRVSRNLAMRRLALGMTSGDAEASPVVLPRWDAEISRLEAPFPKLVLG